MDESAAGARRTLLEDMAGSTRAGCSNPSQHLSQALYAFHRRLVGGFKIQADVAERMGHLGGVEAIVRTHLSPNPRFALANALAAQQRVLELLILDPHVEEEKKISFLHPGLREVAASLGRLRNTGSGQAVHAANSLVLKWQPRLLSLVLGYQLKASYLRQMDEAQEFLSANIRRRWTRKK